MAVSGLVRIQHAIEPGQKLLGAVVRVHEDLSFSASRPRGLAAGMP